MSFLFCQRYLSPRSHFANLLGCQNHFQRGRLPVKEKHFRYNVFCTSKTTRFRLAEGDARGTRSVPLQGTQAQPRRGMGDRGISSHAQLGGKGCPWASFAVRNQQRSNRQSVLVARLRRLRWFPLPPTLEDLSKTNQPCKQQFITTTLAFARLLWYTICVCPPYMNRKM